MGRLRLGLERCVFLAATPSKLLHYEEIFYVWNSCEILFVCSEYPQIILGAKGKISQISFSSKKWIEKKWRHSNQNKKERKKERKRRV